MTLAEQMASIASEVAALEHIVENQRSIISEMQQDAEIARTKDALIDLIAPDIEWQESHLTMRSSERFQKIIDLYRQLRPAGVHNEG